MSETADIDPRSGVDRAYLRAFGPVEEYIKVVRENRPNRWKNLARRAFLGRPTLKYDEVFPQHASEIRAGSRREGGRTIIDALDRIVDELNEIRRACAAERGQKAIPVDALVRLYESARSIVLRGVPGGEEAHAASSSRAASNATSRYEPLGRGTSTSSR